MPLPLAMASTTALDGGVLSPGHWVWDDSERGIVFISHDASSTDMHNRAHAHAARSKVMRSSHGCLLASLDVTFQDVVDAMDEMRFKRHIQRRVNPGEPDVVTLQDVKDVVLFQIQKRLPAEFLNLFHTVAVDKFLRALILYCWYYIQAWDCLALAGMSDENRIREPGLRPAHQQRRENLNCLRALLARDYHTLLPLLGEGRGAAHKKFHPMSNGIQSWTQRDARFWELLLRLAVRVTWVALQRKYLNLIDAEVGRLFRGDLFNSAARKQQTAMGADSSKSPRRTRRQPDLREVVLQCAEEGTRHNVNTLFTKSPATREILNGRHPWMLLALGRLPQPSCCAQLRALEDAYMMPEEEMARVHGMYIGILGMPRANLDTMLTIRDNKQRRQEAVLSVGSAVGPTYQSLASSAEKPHECNKFPFHTSTVVQ